MVKNKSFKIERVKRTPRMFGMGARDADYGSARVVFFPIAYEGTVSYGSGTARGPRAMIDASHYVEWYDEETGTEITAGGGMHTLPIVRISARTKPEVMIKRVYKQCTTLLEDDKFIFGIGGEHSVSLGIMEAYRKKYRTLSILHLDAHADLRESYGGSRYSHACVMRHMAFACPCVHVGIRSLSSIEARFVREKNVPIIFAHNMRENTAWRTRVLELLSEDVYISLDVDVFDPAIMSATGTPEPGGMGWYDVLSLLRGVIETKNVVGCDVVELAPQRDNHAASFLCARLASKIIHYKFCN